MPCTKSFHCADPYSTDNALKCLPCAQACATNTDAACLNTCGRSRAVTTYKTMTTVTLKKRTVSIGARYVIDGMSAKQHTVFEESTSFPVKRSGDTDTYAEWDMVLSSSTTKDHFAHQSLMAMWKTWGGMAVFLVAVFGSFGKWYNKKWFERQLYDTRTKRPMDLREFNVEVSAPAVRPAFSIVYVFNPCSAPFLSFHHLAFTGLRSPWLTN